MRVEGGDLFTCAGVPQRHHAAIGGRQSFAIGRYGDGSAPGALPTEGGYFSTRCCIPNLHFLVIAASEQLLAVGRKHDRVDTPLVTDERGDLLARFYIPEPGCPVAASGSKP